MNAPTPSDPREDMRRIVEQRGLCGLANDTKWNGFVNAMRARPEWRPSYRCKFVHGRVGDWDVEWFAHFPIPIAIEWLDIVFRFEITQGQGPPRVVDHCEWMEAMVRDARFEYVKGDHMLRIFGYSPKDMALFDD